MKFTVAIPIKPGQDSLITLGEDFLSRLAHPHTASAVFVPIKARISEAQKSARMDAEGKELLRVSKNSVCIALCQDGKQYSSETFATFIDILSYQAKNVTFVIGGAFGLSDEVVGHATHKLSVSKMTLPHKLAFVVLCEQLYRAGEILRNSPYHK